MSGRILIGNQTAFSAPSVMEPLEFAVQQGFAAFEWFADKKTDADGTPAGWDETDMDQDKRADIRKIGESNHIRYTVHAPWQANPLYPEGEGLLKRSLDFARDIGADLVNLHLYMDRGAQAYVDALVPIIAYSASCGVRISIENTPLTGPADFNETFRCLDSLDMDTDHVGMCLDIGHANLFSATRHDYIRYIDQLAPEVPIIHLHVHENWGDRDNHLALFTGPARDNEAGIRALVERLQQRHYSGALILEQWPQPPQLLVTAEQRLHALFRSAGKARQRQIRNRSEGVSAAEEPEPHPSVETLTEPALPQDPFTALIAQAHAENSSWRQRLNWIQHVVSAVDFQGSTEQLASLAIYLRFLATGEVSCAEDGRHFRPHHHAGAALVIEQRLEAVTAEQDRWILRKIYPWLPSYSKEFQRSEPLTRIRDIAHRNDIPKQLKQEIKHRLQNKLHRCAGPEDFKTSREILERITAPGAGYSTAFVEQFRIFHQELSEFFNASALDQRLQGLLDSSPPGEAAKIRSLLHLKGETGRSDAHLLQLLKHVTDVREALSRRGSLAEGEQAQRIRLTDIALEDFAFALLSDAANRFAGRHWSGLLEALTIAVINVRCSGVETAECMAVLSELRAWMSSFDPSKGFYLLRLKATLERARRIADRYSDRVLALFPPRVGTLGRALGVAGHTIELFCEGDIRGNVIFQLAKLVENTQRDIRALLNLSPWATVVPGEGSGRLIKCATLEALPQGNQSLIVLLETAQGDEEIPANIHGILLGHPIPHLSHLGVRARQAGVSFATCEEPERMLELESYLNRPVKLRIGGDDVSLAPVLLESGPGNCARQQVTLNIAPVDLCGGNNPVPLCQARISRCGTKASSASRLLNLAEKSSGLFRAPQGLALPFVVMQRCLEQDPVSKKHYMEYQELLRDTNPDEPGDILKALRDILLNLPVPVEICTQIRAFFGESTRLAVRSSANGEDLEKLASAGLYESCIGVSTMDVADAIRQVWASLWTERAANSRVQNGINHQDIKMAVLIQEMLEPELSFIMHTTDPVTGDRDQASVELALGLGETLASAAQPGTPYRLLCNRKSGEAALTACANYSLALRMAPASGITEELIDYSSVSLSSDPGTANRLGAHLAQIAGFLETELGTPQDVEGVIIAQHVYIVQTRAQQGVPSSINVQ